MAISSEWLAFTDSVVDSVRDDPGAYELGDHHGTVVYIGSSDKLRRRLREHLNEPPSTCVRKNATQYRIEYAPNYKEREQDLYSAHLFTYFRAPRCSDAAPGGH